MEKCFLVLPLLLALAACGNGDTKDARPVRTAAAVVAGTASALPTVAVDGYRADYDLVIEGSTVRVLSRTSGAATAHENVGQVEFIDRVTVLDPDGIEGAVYRLYQAAFARKPDPHGLGYWIGAARGGMPLREIADGFMASDEFRSLYGDGDSRSFLSRVYQNVLLREADSAGIDWWVQSLASGTPRVEALIAFSESPENKSNLMPALAAGIDFAPYRTLADHVAVSMNVFTAPPVDTHVLTMAGVEQLGPDSYMLTSAYWDFGLAGADRFRAGPQRLLKWTGERFVDDSSRVAGGIPSMYMAEISGAVGDVNHDGIPDVVLGGNGPDGEGVKSEPSYLLLSKGGAYERLQVPNGAMADGAYPWAHGLTTIQRRGRSNRSVYIGDYAYGPSYISDLGAGGQLEITAGTLPPFLGKPTTLSWANGFAADMGTTAALGVDLDGDGVEELVVGTLFHWTAEHTNPVLNTMHTIVLRQDQQGSFANAEPLALPNGPFPKRDCYQKTDCGSLTVKQISASDFNRDGKVDLVVTHHVYGTDAAGRFFTGSYPQILINKGGLAFEDATLAYFGKDMADVTGGYVHSLPFDLNGDSCTDIVLRGDANNGKQPRVFLNDCKGRFVEFTDKFLKLIPKTDGVFEQMYGGIPVWLGGKPAILLWSGTGGRTTYVHAVRFLSKIPTPTGAAVVF